MFPVDITKFLRTLFFIEHLRWLLLTVLLQYSKVSLRACSLISSLHVLSILSKNLRKTLHKEFFTITWQKNFFLAWIDLSRAFHLRICFGKTVTFDFVEKITQSVAQITSNIMCQKTFLVCTLRLIKCFQFQDMIWKTEECRVSKNI